MSRSNIGQWLQRWFPTRLRRRKTTLKLSRCPLRLEELEDRWLPSTVNWINPASGDWDTAGNWRDASNGTNHVPGATDDAVIATAGILVTHNTSASDTVATVTSSAAFFLGSGSLAITNSGQFNDSFTLAGGTLTGSGTVTLAGPNTLASGTLSGTGVTNLQGSSSIAFGLTNLNTRALNNFGNIDQSQSLITSNAPVVTNESGATWSMSLFQDEVAMSSGTFNNAGTFTDAGVGNNFFDVPVNNSGTINVQSGALFLGGGTDPGTFNVAGSATLAFGSSGGTFDLTTTSSVTGTGSLAFGDSFGNNTVTFSGGLAPTLSIAYIGVQETADFTSAVNGTGSATFTSLGGLFGTLTGTATVTLNGPVIWDVGTMSGTGVTNVNGAMALQGFGTLDTRTLNTFGVTTVTAGLNDGGVINNESGAVWDLQGAFLGGNTFNNFGIVQQSSGSSTMSLFAFNNFGALNVLAGTLTDDSNGTDTASDSVAAGALVDFRGTNFNSGSSLTGAGSVAFHGANSNISGGFTPTGPVLIHNNGTANFSNTVNGTGSATFTSLSLTGGTLTGSGTVTVTGDTDWSGGAMSGTGLTILQGSSTITGTPTLDTRTLNNFGTVSDSANPFPLSNGAIINNASGATWDLQGNASINGTGTFNNFGTLTDSSTATVTVNLPFNNDGTVTVSSGELVVLGNGVDTGTFNIAANATLAFSAGSDTFSNATVAGAGTFVVNSNETITALGNVSIGSANFTFDSSTITGSGTVTVNSAMTWHNGTMSGTGLTILQGSTAITGSNALNTRTLNNFGTVTQNGGIVLSNAAVVNNESGASWTHVAINATVDDFSGTGAFNNAGAFHETGASGGDDHIGVPFNNTGTLDVQSARLTFDAGGTDSGADTVGNGTAIEFNNATYNFTTASSLTGLGGIDFKSGTLNVAGGFTPTGSIFIEGGTANFMNTVNGTGSVTFTSLTLDAFFATLTGAATITVTGATTWSGGTMSGTGETDLLGSTTISPNGVALDTRTLKNFGTVEDNENLALSNAAVIDNEAGATWLLVATNATVFSGTGTFNNAGMFNMSGAGTDSIAIPFNSSGTIHVTSGGLTVLGDGIESGTINIDSSTTMTFSAGSDTFTNGALVNGAGTFAISGNETLTVTGNVTFSSGNFTFDSSTLTGPGTVTIRGATMWTNGATMSGTGVTDLNGSASISGGVFLNTRTLNDNLSVAQTGDVTVSNGGTINLGFDAFWNLQSGSNIFGSGTFNNPNGFFQASGSPGFSQIQLTVNNAGSFAVNSGTVQLQGGGTDSGSFFSSGFSVASGAELDFDGGTHNLTTGSTVTGAGSVEFVTGTANVAGSFTPTGLITIRDTGTANFTNTVNNTGSATFTSLDLRGGLLTGASTIRVTGATTWSAGNMSGTGETDLQGSTTITGTPTLDTRTLNNFGTLTDGATITLINAAILNNESGATWNLQSNASIGGSGTLNNLGTLVDNSAAPITLRLPFNNSGLVQVQSGALTVLGDGIESGTITISGGTSMTFSAGSDTFTNGAVVQGTGTFVVSGAETVTVTGSVNIGSANFTFDNSTLTGSGTVTVTSAMTWNNGTMSGSGVTNLQGSTTITGTPTLDTRTLNNFGNVRSDSITLTVLNAAVINNKIDTLWEIGGSQINSSGTPAGVFNNFGTVTKTFGFTANISTVFNNSGTVNVQSSFLSLFNGGTDTGTFTIGAGGGVQFGTGTHTLTATSRVSGAGQVVFASGTDTTTVAGAFLTSGVVFVDSGTVDFTNTVNKTGSATFSTFVLNGGTLTGAATITVTGATTWASGTMSGSGVTNLLGDSTLSNAGLGPDVLDMRTLNNFGTVAQTVPLILSNAAVLNDESGATWNLQGSASIGGSGTLNNLGTLADNSTTALTLNLPFNNSGLVQVQSGTLTVLGDGVDSGTITVSGGTSMIFSAGSDTFTNGALVNGAGTFVVSGNETLTVTGNVNFGSAIFTFDTSTLTGSGTLTVTSATTWNNGTMSGTGVTDLLGMTTLSGNDTIDTRTLNNFGTLTQQFNLLGNNAPVINNQTGAVWDLNSPLASVALSGTGPFNNLGAFVVSGSNLNDVDLAFNNSGTVTVQGGFLILRGGGVDTGSDAIAGGATLVFSSGTFNLNNGSNVSGAGNVTIPGGTVNVSGNFSPTGLIMIDGGTANFTNTVNGDGLVTFSSLSLSNGNGSTTTNSPFIGTLTGPATITVTGATTWSGGTMSGSGITNLRGATTLTNMTSFLNQRTLNNSGTITESGALNVSNAAVINNESGGVWNLEGNASLGANGTFNNAGTTTLAANSMLTVVSFVQTAGQLSGVGTLSGNVTINGGVVSPGFSPGILTVQGDYTQNSNGSLNIEVDGTASGSQFSVLTVSGTATLDGTLTIARTTGFVPAIGDSFQIVTAATVSGTFATVDGLAINSNEAITVAYGNGNVVLGVTALLVVTPEKLGVVTPGLNGTAVWTLYKDLTSTTAVTTFTFGLATDIPLVGDWGGHGFVSAGVVRPTAGDVAQWSLDTNGDDAYDTGDSVDLFGLNTDIPVVGDWNGSGTTKIGTVRALPDGAAQWSLDSNGNGSFDSSDEVTVYGLATDRFGAGHWTAPGKDELAVVRPGAGGTAEWILNTTGTGYYTTSDTIYTFGLATDALIVGDWNGDGRTNIGVERPGPNGTAVFTLDTNGDGVYDAGDQVIIIPAPALDTFEFGNWKALARLTATDPPNAAVPALQLDATFQADVNLAITEWAQAGLNGAGLDHLRGLTYSVSTLGGGTTALTDGNHIVLDATAAGNGWSEGPTPQPGQLDLVTALAHEMGHALGLGHSPDPNDVMFATLPTGVRRAPTAADVAALGM